MTEEKNAELQEWHRKMAIGLFNAVWSLLDKSDRSPDEDDRMLHAAHASRFHWGEIGTPLEFERGEWQVSRVYAELRRPEAALHHAKRCLEICQENDITDFDIAFAYEALARAYAVSGNGEKSREFIRLGQQAGEQIEDEENRNYFLSELNAVTKLIQD
jgi:hypothetical protein